MSSSSSASEQENNPRNNSTDNNSNSNSNNNNRPLSESQVQRLQVPGAPGAAAPTAGQGQSSIAGQSQRSRTGSNASIFSQVLNSLTANIAPGAFHQIDPEYSSNPYGSDNYDHSRPLSPGSSAPWGSHETNYLNTQGNYYEGERREESAATNYNSITNPVSPRVLDPNFEWSGAGGARIDILPPRERGGSGNVASSSSTANVRNSNNSAGESQGTGSRRGSFNSAVSTRLGPISEHGEAGAGEQASDNHNERAGRDRRRAGRRDKPITGESGASPST